MSDPELIDMRDSVEFCAGCGAHYTQDHGIGCPVVAAQKAEMDRIRASHLKKEEAKGELIAEQTCNPDGVYVEHPDDPVPVLTLYNQGGHDCASVYVSEVIAWVKRRRPDLLG